MHIGNIYSFNETKFKTHILPVRFIKDMYVFLHNKLYRKTLEKGAPPTTAERLLNPPLELRVGMNVKRPV